MYFHSVPKFFFDQTSYCPTVFDHKAVDLHPDIVRWLESFANGSGNAVMTIIERYTFLSRSCIPTLSREAWMGVINGFCGYSGSYLQIGRYSYRSPYDYLSEAVQSSVEGFVSEPPWLDEIVSLSELQALAVLDLNDRYWSRDQDAIDLVEQAEWRYGNSFLPPFGDVSEYLDPQESSCVFHPLAMESKKDS